jgi:hypothetical protein
MKLKKLVNKLKLSLEEGNRLALVTHHHVEKLMVLGEDKEGVVRTSHRSEPLIEVFLIIQKYCQIKGRKEGMNEIEGMK